MLTFVMAALTGVLVGVLSGLLGIGGGTVMVPIFRLGFGMSAIEATATSLFTIIPTSLAGCVTHLRNRTCVLPLGLAAGLGGALTSPVGVWLASVSPSWAIMLAAALIIGYSATSMLKKAAKMKPAGKDEGPAKDCAATCGKTRVSNEASNEASSDVSEEDSRVASGATSKAALVEGTAGDGAAGETMTRRQLVLGALIGLGAGVASGYVGVGGGFIMVPLFVSVIGIAMKKASGTSLIAVTILAIPGAIEQALLGNVQFSVGIALAIGSIPGAVLGAQLVRFVPERTLRFIFGGFLIVVAAILALNEFLLA